MSELPDPINPKSYELICKTIEAKNRVPFQIQKVVPIKVAMLAKRAAVMVHVPVENVFALTLAKVAFIRVITVNNL